MGEEEALDTSSGCVQVFADVTELRVYCGKVRLARLPRRISSGVRSNAPLERGGHRVQGLRERRECAAEPSMRLDKISRRGHRGEMGRALANLACGSFYDGCHDCQTIVGNLVVHDGKLHPRGHPQGGHHGTVHVIVNHVSVA